MTKDEEKLLGFFRSMNSDGQSSLLDYAAYLSSRYEQQPTVSEPLEIDRPHEETVVAAIKRLSKTYPMLDRQVLLHETSNYMMQHIMHGRASVEVIDDLEVYFRKQYEQLGTSSNDSDS